MKLKSGFFLNEMGDEFVVVAMTEEAKKEYDKKLSKALKEKNKGKNPRNKMTEEAKK